jgi:hypothetical protein
MKAQRRTGTQWGERERLHIRTFKTSCACYTFLGKQNDNYRDDRWRVYDGPLNTGTYVMAGGQWLNIKTLSASQLAQL